MKLPNTDIERAAASNDIRRYLNHVHLDVENQNLVACAGSILAVVPVEVDEGDTTGPITKDAIKLARKGAKKNEPTVLANGSLSIPAQGVTMARPDDGVFPDYQRVLIRDEDLPTICLDADLLVDLASALNRRGSQNNGVRLHLPRNVDAPIKVEPMWGPAIGTVGVLSPMRDDHVGQHRYNKLAEDQLKLATAKELLARCLDALAEAKAAMPEHDGMRHTFAAVEEFLTAK